MTTHEIPETTLERVRKLLAKAERTDNEHERDTFMKAAASLMAKYGIEQAMIEPEQARQKPGNRVVYVEDGPYQERHLALVYLVSEAMRCKAVTVAPRYGVNTEDRKAIHLFGYTSDLERAEVMYTSLMLQMSSGLNRLVIPAGYNTRSYRNSWCLGFISTVVEIIEERERAAEAEVASTGTELVLLDRGLAVRSEFLQVYPKVRKTYARSSGRGYAAGQEAGRRANFGGTGVGGGRGQLSR